MLSAQDARDEMFKSLVSMIDSYIKTNVHSLKTRTSPITLSWDKTINEKVVAHLLSLNFTVEYWKNRTNVIIVSW